MLIYKIETLIYNICLTSAIYISMCIYRCATLGQFLIMQFLMFSFLKKQMYFAFIRDYM